MKDSGQNTRRSTIHRAVIRPPPYYFLTTIILFANRVQNECEVTHYQYYECNNNTVILLFNRLESYWFGDASAHHCHRLVPDTHSWRFAI